MELGRATKSGLLLGLLLPAALGLDRLVGMKGGSGAQKSCRGRKPSHYSNQIFKIHLEHIFLDIVSEQAERFWKGEILFFLVVLVSRNQPGRDTILNLLAGLFAAGYVINVMLCNTKETPKEKK